MEIRKSFLSVNWTGEVLTNEINCQESCEERRRKRRKCLRTTMSIVVYLIFEENLPIQCRLYKTILMAKIAQKELKAREGETAKELVTSIRLLHQP